MDEQMKKITQKLEEQDKKLDAIYRSSEKTRRYFLWTLVISVLVIALPLIGLLIVIPQFLNTLNVGNLGL